MHFFHPQHAGSVGAPAFVCFSNNHLMLYECSTAFRPEIDQYLKFIYIHQLGTFQTPGSPSFLGTYKSPPYSSQNLFPFLILQLLLFGIKHLALGTLQISYIDFLAPYFHTFFLCTLLPFLVACCNCVSLWDLPQVLWPTQSSPFVFNGMPSSLWCPGSSILAPPPFLMLCKDKVFWKTGLCLPRAFLLILCGNVIFLPMSCKVWLG